MPNLSKREKVAMWVMHHWQEKEIPLRFITCIREVLMWGEGENIIGFEYKYFADPKFSNDILELRRLFKKSG
jgi:hypothetical protein